jgi:hypothetical protein
VSPPVSVAVSDVPWGQSFGPVRPAGGCGLAPVAGATEVAVWAVAEGLSLWHGPSGPLGVNR